MGRTEMRDVTRFDMWSPLIQCIICDMFFKMIILNSLVMATKKSLYTFSININKVFETLKNSLNKLFK